MKWASSLGEWTGYASVSFGFWLAYPPLGFIAAGVFIWQWAVPLRKTEDKDEGEK